jgi:hypothetical protein
VLATEESLKLFIYSLIRYDVLTMHEQPSGCDTTGDHLQLSSIIYRLQDDHLKEKVNINQAALPAAWVRPDCSVIDIHQRRTVDAGSYIIIV